MDTEAIIRMFKRLQAILAQVLILVCILAANGRAIELRTDESNSVEAYNQVLKLFKAGDVDTAAQGLEKILKQNPNFNRAYDKLIEFRKLQGQPSIAKEYFEKLYNSSVPVPQAYLGLALYYKDKDRVQAFDYIVKCVELCPQFAAAYTELINIAAKVDRLSAAENLIQKIIKEQPNNSAVFYGLGCLYYIQAQPEEKVIAQFDKAITLDATAWEPYYYKFVVYYRAQKTDRVLAALQPMLAKATAANDLEWRGRIIGSIGYMGNYTGDYRKAVDNLLTSLHIAQEINYRSLEQACLASIGIAYHQTGQYQLALEYLEKSLQVAQELNDVGNSGRSIGLIADLYIEQAKYSQAIDYYLQAASMAKEEHDNSALASHYSNISLVYTKWAYYSPALQYIEKAFNLIEKIENDTLEGNFLEIRGVIYQQLKQYSNALNDFSKALQLAEKLKNNRAVVLRLTYLGRVYTSLNNRDAALKCYQQALKKASETVVSTEAKPTANLEEYILLGFAELSAKSEDYQQAETYYRKALAIGGEKSLPEIVWRSEEGLATICKANNRLEEARTHYINAIEAIEKVRGVLKIDEEKAGFFQDKVEVYNDLVQLLVSQADNESQTYQAEIFHYMEGRRARAFLDSMTDAILNLSTGIDEHLINQQRELQARISTIQSQLILEYRNSTFDEKKIDQLSVMLNYADEERLNLQRKIRSLYPNYDDLQNSSIAKLDQVQQLLDDQTALLEYSLGEKYSFLFIVTKQKSYIVSLANEVKITEYVQKLRAAISKPNRAALANYLVTAQSLYQELIQPAAKFITGKTSLIIVPDSSLYYLPFETLLKTESKLSNTSSFNPDNLLINDFAISYIPSASVLVKLSTKQRSERPPKRFLAFADPLYPQDQIDNSSAESPIRQVMMAQGHRWQLSRLPSSQEEVTGIAQLFPKDQTKLFLQKDATEENVKSGSQLDNYQIIHFAVHGILNSEKPQFSALVFSLPTEKPEIKNNGAISDINNAPQDGLLQVHEIFNLKLNADMVVLSACETGLGKEIKGEGIVGMTRAFLYAGTSSVVTSLWKVSDTSTPNLMIDFYRRLTSQGLSKAEALRAAKLATLKKNNLRHPYYWAPFILTGR